MEFPLYLAPVEKAPCFHGFGKSIISGEESHQCFRLGIGATLVIKCPRCKNTCYLDCGEDDLPSNCKCGEPFPFNTTSERLITYQELRAGRGLITKDTEAGMISEEQLITGWTHGNPNPDFLRGFEIRKDPESEDGWYQAKVSTEDMYELLRTPDYETWQGDNWQFHNGHPMAFVGEWNRDDFDRNRGDATVEDFMVQVLGSEFRCSLEYEDAVCKYIFQDTMSGIFKGHYDFD